MIIKYRIFLFCLLLFLCYTQAIANDNRTDSLYQTGLALLHSQKPESALVIFKQIIEDDYYRPEGHYGLGLTLQMLYPDSNLAISHYEQTIKLSDDFKAPAWYQLGHLYKKMESYQEAIDAFEQHLRYDPSNRQGWYLLDTLTQLAAEPPPESALDRLPKLLHENPANDTLGTLYLRSALWHDKSKKAVNELSKIYDRGFRDRWLILALLDLQFRNENYENGMALLDSHAVQMQHQAPFEQQLFLAKYYFQLSQDSLGLSQYWQAIHSLLKSLAAGVFHSTIFLPF
jgi:tetratricopeptide (TPR) repeat protein